MYFISLQHFCDIYHKQNFATCSVSVYPSDIPHFATFNHTQNITHFTIHNVSLQTLRVTRHRKLALFGTSHFAFEYVSQTSSQIFTNFSVVYVSQVAMCVSSQISERVIGKGSFAIGFTMSSDSQNAIKKIKNLLNQMEAINPLNHYYNLFCLSRLSENISKVRIAVLLFLKIKLHNGA